MAIYSTNIFSVVSAFLMLYFSLDDFCTHCPHYYDLVLSRRTYILMTDCINFVSLPTVACRVESKH